MSNLFDIFGMPSFEPLHQHMLMCFQCAQKLDLFFQKALESDWVACHSIQNEINELEEKADMMKETIRLHTPSSLFMSVERSDLLDLVSLQDRIANKTKQITGVMISRKMKFPDPVGKEMHKLLKQSIFTCEQLLLINKEIKGLMTSGFRKQEADRIENMIHQLDKSENDTDNIEINVRELVFEIEKNWHPVEVMFLYKLIDWLGDLANKAQQSSHRILLLIAR